MKREENRAGYDVSFFTDRTLWNMKLKDRHCEEPLSRPVVWCDVAISFNLYSTVTIGISASACTKANLISSQ